MDQVNTMDLIKSAEERKYVKFEELALDTLKDKLDNHPKVQEFRDTLNSISEASKDEDKDGDDDTTEKGDTDKDEDEEDEEDEE